MPQYDFSTLRASNARDPNSDAMMQPHIIEQRIANTKCKLDGCENHLTIYKGPGSATLCRSHQVLLREYGGNGRIDRPYTLWKKDCCEMCNHNPSEDNVNIKSLPHPYGIILGKMMLHVDHIVKAGREKYIMGHPINNPNNLQTLCQECHMVKTYLEGDHMKNNC